DVWWLVTLWIVFFFFSSRRRHTRLQGDWSSDVCSSDLFYQHQNLDGAWSDRLYWTPRRTQSATGLYAHDDNESTSSRAFEKIVPLLRGPGERNIPESTMIFAGSALALLKSA